MGLFNLWISSSHERCERNNDRVFSSNIWSTALFDIDNQYGKEKVDQNRCSPHVSLRWVHYWLQALNNGLERVITLQCLRYKYAMAYDHTLSRSNNYTLLSIRVSLVTESCFDSVFCCESSEWCSYYLIELYDGRGETRIVHGAMKWEKGKYCLRTWKKYGLNVLFPCREVGWFQFCPTIWRALPRRWGCYYIRVLHNWIQSSKISHLF